MLFQRMTENHERGTLLEELVDMFKILSRLIARMSKSKDTTLNEALEFMERTTMEKEDQRQQYAAFMGDALAFYGDSILEEMEKNGESWEDVQKTKVRPPARPGANPFYIWTTKFVYFANLVGGISSNINVRSIPRDPAEDVDPRWQNIPRNPAEDAEPKWH